jgi:phosphatidylglycerophosphate synthase
MYLASPRRIVDMESSGFFERTIDELVFSTPALLTSVRVVLASVLFTILVEGGRGFPFFALACLTDVFDGALARWLNAESKFGGLLDASADFLLVFSTSAFLVWKGIVSIWFLSLMVVAFARYVFGKDALGPDPLGKHIGTVIFVALGTVLVFPVLFVASWATVVASCYIVVSMMLRARPLRKSYPKDSFGLASSN